MISNRETKKITVSAQQSILGPGDDHNNRVPLPRALPLLFSSSTRHLSRLFSRLITAFRSLSPSFHLSPLSTSLHPPLHPPPLHHSP